MNKIIISGNLTAKPEMKTVKSGSSVCVFTVAVKNAQKTDFYRVNAWSKIGESCFKYLDKGYKVVVVGDFNPSLYEGNNKTFMNLDVTAEQVDFMSSAKKNDFHDINPSELPF